MYIYVSNYKRKDCTELVEGFVETFTKLNAKFT